MVLAIWTGRQAPRDVRKLQATDRLAGVSDAGDPVPQSEATLALMQVIDTVFLDYPAQPRLVYRHYVPVDAAGAFCGWQQSWAGQAARFWPGGYRTLWIAAFAWRFWRRRSPDTAKPQIFNTDQGSQVTSQAFTGVWLAAETGISMDGRGPWIADVRWFPSRSDPGFSASDYSDHSSTSAST